MSKKKEMVYEWNNETSETLLSAFYKGYWFIINNCHHDHPCAYVEVEILHPFVHGTDWKNYCESISIPDVHGGVTYADKQVWLRGKWLDARDDCIWIGWDYGHAGDYTPHWDGAEPEIEHKWTTDEVAAECMKVIDHLVAEDDRILDMMNNFLKIDGWEFMSKDEWKRQDYELRYHIDRFREAELAKEKNHEK